MIFLLSRQDKKSPRRLLVAWWRRQMEIFSALLALCAGNSPVTGEFPPQRPVTQSFDVFFDLRLNKRLGKQSWGGDFRRHRAHYDVIVMESPRELYLSRQDKKAPTQVNNLSVPEKYVPKSIRAIFYLVWMN